MTKSYEKGFADGLESETIQRDEWTAEEVKKARQDERERIIKLFINHYYKIIQEWTRYRGKKTFFKFCDNYLKSL